MVKVDKVDWTPADIAKITELWLAKHIVSGIEKPKYSASEIGDRMGRSKSGIIGKASRLGLPGRPSPIKGIREAQIDADLDQPRTLRSATIQPLPAMTAIQPVTEQPEPPAKKITIATREAPDPDAIARIAITDPRHPNYVHPARKRDKFGCGCQWPIGEPGQRGFRLCDADLAGRVYCAEHQARAWTPATRRRSSDGSQYAA